MNRGIRTFTLPTPTPEQIRSLTKPRTMAVSDISTANLLCIRALAAVGSEYSPQSAPLELSNPKELFKGILAHFEEKMLSFQKFAQFWQTLALARVGLSADQLARVLDVKRAKVEELLKAFSFALVRTVDDSWRVHGVAFQDAVYEKYTKTEEKRTRCHQLIGLALLREKRATPVLVSWLSLYCGVVRRGAPSPGPRRPVDEG